MTTINADQRTSLLLSPGFSLTVVTAGTGYITRSGDQPGEENQSITALTTGSIAFGPYNEPTRWQLGCLTGTISTTVDLTVPAAVGAFYTGDIELTEGTISVVNGLISAWTPVEP